MAEGLFVALFTAVVDSAEQQEREKIMNKSADVQYNNDMVTLNERLRRTELANNQQVSRTRALSGASGIAFTGSVENYTDEMDKNFIRNRDWMRKAGTFKAQTARKNVTTEIEKQRRDVNVSSAARITGTGSRSYFKGSGGQSKSVRETWITEDDYDN